MRWVAGERNLEVSQMYYVSDLHTARLAIWTDDILWILISALASSIHPASAIWCWVVVAMGNEGIPSSLSLRQTFQAPSDQARWDA